MRSNHLILFTASFPFENGEPFLETEIRYLAKAFEKVTIISQANSTTNQREVPENVEVRNLKVKLSKAERVLSLMGRFSKIYREERRIIRETEGLNWNIPVIKTFVISLARAKKIEKIARNLNSEFAEYSNYFYSYWSDDSAIGLALFRSKNPEIRCFSRVHGWDVYFEASAIGYLPMRKYLARNLDAIFAISQAGKDYCENRWGIDDPAKVRIARLGVQQHEFHAGFQEPFTIVSCANMIPLKRIHLLIDALGMLETKKQIRWVHFGDGPLSEELKRRAATKIPEEIDVQFAGHRSNSELMQWYAENRPALFVNTSSTEGIPVSIMEAMSFGTPIIATDVGGTSEIVNGTNGKLIHAGFSANELKNELVKIINAGEEQMGRYRSEAYKSWDKKFNSDTNYIHFIDQIKAL